MTEIQPEPAATLRGMAEGDEDVMEGLLEIPMENVEESGLDLRVHALVRLAALVALDAPEASYTRLVSTALRSGATVDDVVGVLVAVAPQVGAARVVAAAHQVLRALEVAAGRAGEVGGPGY